MESDRKIKVYVAATWWPGHESIEKGSPLDLEKIGQSINPEDRVRKLTYGCQVPVKVRLVATFEAPGLTDHVIHRHLRELETQHLARPAQARRMGLRQIYEWYQGGTHLEVSNYLREHWPNYVYWAHRMPLREEF